MILRGVDRRIISEAKQMIVEERRASLDLTPSNSNKRSHQQQISPLNNSFVSEKSGHESSAAVAVLTPNMKSPPLANHSTTIKMEILPIALQNRPVQSSKPAQQEELLKRIHQVESTPTSDLHVDDDDSENDENTQTSESIENAQINLKVTKSDSINNPPDNLINYQLELSPGVNFEDEEEEEVQHSEDDKDDERRRMQNPIFATSSMSSSSPMSPSPRYDLASGGVVAVEYPSVKKVQPNTSHIRLISRPIKHGSFSDAVSNDGAGSVGGTSAATGTAAAAGGGGGGNGSLSGGRKKMKRKVSSKKDVLERDETESVISSVSTHRSHKSIQSQAELIASWIFGTSASGNNAGDGIQDNNSADGGGSTTSKSKKKKNGKGTILSNDNNGNGNLGMTAEMLAEFNRRQDEADHKAINHNTGNTPQHQHQQSNNNNNNNHHQHHQHHHQGVHDNGTPDHHHHHHHSGNLYTSPSPAHQQAARTPSNIQTQQKKSAQTDSNEKSWWRVLF